MLFLTPNTLSMIIGLPEEMLWSLSDDLPESLSEGPLSVKLILRHGDQELILEDNLTVGNAHHIGSDGLLTFGNTRESEHCK